METLRQSYSMNDLRVEGEEDLARGRRFRYKQSDYEAEMRRSRRAQTGSMLALTSESHQEREEVGRRGEAEVPRRRAASVRQKKPASSSGTARPSSMYGTLPRSASLLSCNDIRSFLSLGGDCRSLPSRRPRCRQGGWGGPADRAGRAERAWPL